MQAEAGPGFLLTLCTLVVWMKLVSYAHCNADLRAARRLKQLRSGERGSMEAPSWAKLQYPENLTVGNMLVFLAVPTLVYQVGGLCVSMGCLTPSCSSCAMAIVSVTDIQQNQPVSICTKEHVGV